MAESIAIWGFFFGFRSVPPTVHYTAQPEHKPHQQLLVPFGTVVIVDFFAGLDAIIGDEGEFLLAGQPSDLGAWLVVEQVQQW